MPCCLHHLDHLGQEGPAALECQLQALRLVEEIFDIVLDRLLRSNGKGATARGSEWTKGDLAIVEQFSAVESREIEVR